MNPQWKYGMRRRMVEVSDARFILDLRRNERRVTYLSAVSPVLEDQEAWIRKYKDREAAGEEYYFLYENAQGDGLGVYRLYHLAEDSFEAGSWIFRKGLAMGTPILGDIASKDFGFEDLGYTRCRFEVLKDNKSGLKYQERLGAIQVGEDGRACYYHLDKERYIQRRDLLLKRLIHH